MPSYISIVKPNETDFGVSLYASLGYTRPYTSQRASPRAERLFTIDLRSPSECEPAEIYFKPPTRTLRTLEKITIMDHNGQLCDIDRVRHNRRRTQRNLEYL